MRASAASNYDPRVVELANRFINQAFYGPLLREFREAHSSPLLNGGSGGEAFRRQLDQELIDRMSGRDLSPLTRAVLRQMGSSARRPGGAAGAGAGREANRQA